MNLPLNRRIGHYVRHMACRFCQGSKLVKFLDLGVVPLAGAFLKPEEFESENFYPLEIQFCQDCTLVQVNNAVPGDVLFKKNYFYFSSAIQTLITHFGVFAREMAERFLRPGQSFAVEIGCNDGVLLKPLMGLGVRCLGVDPATNVVKSIGSPDIQVVNDFFTEKVAIGIRDQHGQADAVLSSFSFAHIDDMVDVMNGVKALLKEDGVFVFEVYYLGTVLEEMQYDMIYHEHMSYYSLMALEKFFTRFGMEIFDLKRIPLRAGTIRFYAQNIGRRTEAKSPAVDELRAYERDNKFDAAATYMEYGDKVKKTRTDLLRLLDDLKRNRKRIVGYGASGRATTIMTFCGIDSRYLDFVVDDAPAKHGYFTPGTHVPIKPWSAVEGSSLPDYALVFAWSFIEEVKKKRIDYLTSGGKFIVPLPDVKVISE